MDNIEVEADKILKQLTQDERYARYVDAALPIPKPYKGLGIIKLIVLGQDPTIKNPLGRKSIETVLNLDKNGSVRAYLAGVCNDLGIKITENVYATNLYKNFFIQPPTQITRITKVDLFQTFINPWLPLLLQEIAQFVDVPILTLGQPILAPLVKRVSAKLGYYWGHTPDWMEGGINPFKFIGAEENLLNRIIFPFPHQRTRQNPFYKTHLRDYTLFMRSVVYS
jgi:hypothetical protein